MRLFTILFFTSIFFYGCSFGGEYFLRNSSEKELIVKMKYREDSDSIALTGLEYIEEVEKIKRKTFKNRKPGLMPFKVEGNNLWFKIPPKSLVSFGGGFNFQYIGPVEFIEIEGKETNLNDPQIWSDLRTRYLAYVCWLEI